MSGYALDIQVRELIYFREKLERELALVEQERHEISLQKTALKKRELQAVDTCRHAHNVVTAAHRRLLNAGLIGKEKRFEEPEHIVQMRKEKRNC